MRVLRHVRSAANRRAERRASRVWNFAPVVTNVLADIHREVWNAREAREAIDSANREAARAEFEKLDAIFREEASKLTLTDTQRKLINHLRANGERVTDAAKDAIGVKGAAFNSMIAGLIRKNVLTVDQKLTPLSSYLD